MFDSDFDFEESDPRLIDRDRRLEDQDEASLRPVHWAE